MCFATASPGMVDLGCSAMDLGSGVVHVDRVELASSLLIPDLPVVVVSAK